MALADNQLAYWKFNESSGDAEDASGNGKTLTNTNSIAYATGKISNGADLESGSSQYFVRANGTYFDVTSGTVNCWIKLESNGVAQRIISNYTNSGSGGFNFHVTAANKLASFFGDGTNQATGATSLSTATWYMVTFTWNTSRKEIFLNAVSDAANETDETMTAGEANISIGRDQKFPGDYFDGLIDEMGIWSRVLSGTEITELYNSGAGKSYPFVVQNLTLTAAVGAFTLTGVAAAIGRVLTLTASAGSFILTGVSAILTRLGWSNLAKSSSSWANPSKNTATWTNLDQS